MVSTVPLRQNNGRGQFSSLRRRPRRFGAAAGIIRTERKRHEPEDSVTPSGGPGPQGGQLTPPAFPRPAAGVPRRLREARMARQEEYQQRLNPPWTILAASLFSGSGLERERPGKGFVQQSFNLGSERPATNAGEASSDSPLEDSAQNASPTDKEPTSFGSSHPKGSVSSVVQRSSRRLDGAR